MGNEMINKSHYNLLADLFDYPRSGFPERVLKVQKFLGENYPEAGNNLGHFAHFVSEATLTQMEELYSRSFDVQAITTLDLGYVLFGDDYKRGAILSNLNREITQAKLDTGTELADHLPNVLRLLPELKEEELVTELVAEIVAPALTRMIAEFDPKRLEQKNKLYQKHYKTLIATSDQYALLYAKPLTALLHVIKKDFQWVEKLTPLPSIDFLKSVDTEMRIENEYVE